jgi:diadenosine tetraphosphate (Ap4A) HIT family hydrolase
VLCDDGRARVVAIDEADYPGFLRVIWDTHVKETTDLSVDERQHLMRVVFAVEEIQRSTLLPDKMNVASLGNMTPHLHWHLIPRYHDDAHFPGPIWSERRRTTDPAVLATRRARLAQLDAAIARALRAA